MQFFFYSLGIGYICCFAPEINIPILDENDRILGNILIPKGRCPENTNPCYCSELYYEVSLPQNATSIEKFQIVADIIHFDLENKLI